VVPSPNGHFSDTGTVTKPCHDGLRNTGQRHIFHGIAEAMFF
jgi:hypothetical protein